MLIPDVNLRELGELMEHFESRPDLWRNVHDNVWARYEGDSVVMVAEPGHCDDGRKVIEIVWSQDGFLQSVTYTDWLLNHFTSRGLRLRLQELLPHIGPNMVASIVDLLDGWQEQKSEDDLAAEELKTEKEKRLVTLRDVSRMSPLLKKADSGQVAMQSEAARVMSPYLKKLLGRK